MSAAPVECVGTSPHPGSDLPPCHSRRDYWPLEGIFFCAHPRVHVRDNLVSVAICRICSRFLEPPPAEFRPYPVILTSERQGPCLHLGDQVGLRECSTCQGNVKLKVFGCSHPAHGETTLPDCERCVDYERRLSKATKLTWSVG